jgi:hypothetical protein
MNVWDMLQLLQHVVFPGLLLWASLHVLLLRLLLLLQASVYDLYDLLSLCADQLPAAPPKAASSNRRGPGRKQAAAPPPAIETEALAACARIVGGVTPGSSAHADLTTEYMVR